MTSSVTRGLAIAATGIGGLWPVTALVKRTELAWE
jgi:hypothetical protein